MIDPDNKNDFQDFLNSKKAYPSEKLNQRILSFVQKDLSPSHKTVFIKLLLVQAFIGLITLTFCPQFNLSLTNNYDLFHFFHHKFGEKICMAVCGSVFIGSGALFATYLLKASEIQKIKQSRFLYFTSISILALSSFFLVGSDIYLTLATYWLLGAASGGILVFEFNRLLRKNIFQY